MMDDSCYVDQGCLKFGLVERRSDVAYLFPPGMCGDMLTWRTGSPFRLMRFR